MDSVAEGHHAAAAVPPQNSERVQGKRVALHLHAAQGKRVAGLPPQLESLSLVSNLGSARVEYLRASLPISSGGCVHVVYQLLLIEMQNIMDHNDKY